MNYKKRLWCQKLFFAIVLTVYQHSYLQWKDPESNFSLINLGDVGVKKE